MNFLLGVVTGLLLYSFLKGDLKKLVLWFKGVFNKKKDEVV